MLQNAPRQTREVNIRVAKAERSRTNLSVITGFQLQLLLTGITLPMAYIAENNLRTRVMTKNTTYRTQREEVCLKDDGTT